MTSSLLLTGIGLRPMHYAAFLEKKPNVAWIEIHSENYFAEGGQLLHIIDKLRADYPISLHGVSLSLGSADELNWHHLRQLRDLVQFVEPCLISDHLSFSSINGHYLHDLLPIPFTEEVLDHVVSRVQQVQDYLHREILLENISSYFTYEISTIPEADFLSAVAERTGCGILLDINNLYVNANNVGLSPQHFLKAIDPKNVQEIHLGGFSLNVINNKNILVDTHSRPIDSPVWDLFRFATQLLGRKPTIIEWDNELPSLDILYLEAFHAEKILRETHVAAESTN